MFAITNMPQLIFHLKSGATDNIAMTIRWHRRRHCAAYQACDACHQIVAVGPFGAVQIEKAIKPGNSSHTMIS